MKPNLNLLKTINTIALLFLLLGGYGLPFTGALQLLAATLYLTIHPRNKLIYIYFSLVFLFFIGWDGSFDWFFTIPILLIFLLTYIIHFQNKPKKAFLTAQWNNLILVNYEIDTKLLEKHLPKGTEIDFYENKCYVSLVGFLFEETRLLGLKVPFHVNFEEVNLRFYVKRFENKEWKRGVVFIKEIVPKPALTFVANTIYKERYQTLPMKHCIEKSQNTTNYNYQWKLNNKWNTMRVVTNNQLIPIEEYSTADFICEHYYGYTKHNAQTTFEYEVKHPKWEQQEVLETVIDVDFEKLYGMDFKHLETSKPSSVIFAKGSTISVENKRKLS
ncbi:YqjF family protein [Flavobacterium muglaense]|uniref:DUF2071 domain-containing protein n=1 Tax=Flavobacterium muglaense TaxID=2764716 RepID=A0A923N1Q1_9FLAO|nr:DUF2071 domain-containing protein [Flavobacterium muglaense]MBC5839045.1 DUF2071 domain-containing protein [Flavobacterium muglaense]MBC5845709.1 DUF2071 domain-containing protein [Flavobacterium muglaense]